MTAFVVAFVLHFVALALSLVLGVAVTERKGEQAGALTVLASALVLGPAASALLLAAY